jgi:hypothetical protein
MCGILAGTRPPAPGTQAHEVATSSGTGFHPRLSWPGPVVHGGPFLSTRNDSPTRGNGRAQRDRELDAGARGR